MTSKKKDLTEDEMKALMDEHNQQVETLENNMNMEKNRQVALISSKIAEKKRKRAAALAKRHEAESKEQLMKEKSERNNLLDEQVKYILFM